MNFFMIFFMLLLSVVSPSFASNDAFFNAVNSGDVAKAKEILNNGGKVNESTYDGLEMYPLNIAILAGKLEMVKFLLEEGADINKTTKFDLLSPLRFAVDVKNTEILRLLLSQGADLSIRDREGGTALHRAAFKGNLDAISLFLEKGANLKDQSTGVPGLKNGGTPLHVAVQNKQLNAVKLLIEKGADVSALNGDGETPAMIAVYFNNIDALKLLQQNKADLNIANPSGKTALKIAREVRAKQEIIDILLNAGARE
ncbi:MAG: ankyrin repeat domain-containing protein [Candidatus Riflebacteria bacterium]|nr:ankyrin repeat domain-containing protein [Candidatus Riflebacteria bacterium]